MNRRGLYALAPSLLGAALLIPIARHYRIDAMGDDCSLWPSATTNVLYGALYTASLALLTLGWRRVERVGLSLGHVLLVGALVHAVALFAPPFLSLDPLCYSAVGRAMTRFHQNPYRALGESLPAGDPFLQLLPNLWRLGGSAYWPLFNWLSALIASIAGDRLALHLRLYQGVGAIAMMGTALVSARAVTAATGERTAGDRAAAFVLLSPIAILEATVGAHNDALLALSVALFALLVAKRRQLAGAAALASGLLVKASGLLVLGMDAAYLVLVRARRFITPARLWITGGVGLVLAIGAFLLLRERVAALGVASALVGSAHDSVEHCTRSFECVPRALLHWVFHLPTAAWLVGLAFRAAGGLWLLYAAYAGARQQRQLEWIAAGLFVYYLFFHGFLQSWYLLSLLPLVPLADARLRPAMRVFLVSALAYYPIRMLLNCVLTPAVVGGKELAEGLVVLVPALVMLSRKSAAVVGREIAR